MPRSPIVAAGTSLPKKLGLLPAKPTPLSVALVGEPGAFRVELGELPAPVRFVPRLSPDTNIAICFVRTLSELNALFELLATQLPPKASVWIARPKQQHKPGFNENQVRAGGLAIGLVDYKICSFTRTGPASSSPGGVKRTARRT